MKVKTMTQFRYLRMMAGVLLALTGVLFSGAKVESVKGKAVLIRNFAKTPVKPGQELNSKDYVVTEKGARVRIKFEDESVVVMPASSRLKLSDLQKDSSGKDGTRLDLLDGLVRAKVKPGNKQSFQVVTPSAVAGVRGTDFSVMHRNNKTNVHVFKGQVQVIPSIPKVGRPVVPATSVMLNPGQTCNVDLGMPPSPPRAIQPVEARVLEDMMPIDESREGKAYEEIKGDSKSSQRESQGLTPPINEMEDDPVGEDSTDEDSEAEAEDDEASASPWSDNTFTAEEEVSEDAVDYSIIESQQSNDLRTRAAQEFLKMIETGGTESAYEDVQEDIRNEIRRRTINILPPGPPKNQ